MAWTARNNGLTGAALNVNYIAQHPRTRTLRSNNHELLIATDDGLYHSINGGRGWAKITLPDPTGGATVDELTFHWVDYDPTNSDIVYVLGIKAVANQQWIYKTSDALATWSSRLVATS